MPRFVVLRHIMPPDSDRRTHFDLMLEFGTTLRTWELDGPPQPGSTMSARSLPDHRLAFLDYEGPISRGRGEVHRWDFGEFVLIHQSTTTLSLTLSGQHSLLRVETTRESTDPEIWRFRFTADSNS